MMSFSAILFLKTPVSDIRLQRCPAEKEGAANIQEEPSNEELSFDRTPEGKAYLFMGGSDEEVGVSLDSFKEQVMNIVQEQVR